MSKPMNKWLHIFLIPLVVVSLTACDKISIPRLSFDEEPETKIPISVNYRFDPNLSQHTQVVDACGFPYTIKSGEIITQTFLKVGQERFVSVNMLPKDSASSSPNDLTVDLKLVQSSFEPVGRSGEEDRYHANIGLQLQAVYQDSHGQALAKTPLTYSDKAHLWTPALSSQSTSCATGQFNEVFENAAETLARDMVSVIPQLYGQPPQTPSQAKSNQSASPLSQAIPIQKPSLSFRTMLQDENDNLVLEGGENLVLQIETTNTGSTPLDSAYVELRGSQTIIDAFTQVAALPISIGALQPGEKKTTEVRGQMPVSVEQEKGELIVSISLSQGIPPGAHTILAAIQPPTSLQQSALPHNAKQPPSNEDGKKSKKSQSAGSPYYAIIVGLNEYRDPWPNAYQVPQQHIQGMAEALRTTGIFPSDHIKVLNGIHATRTDIEEALFTWAKHQLTSDAVFLLYFSGHALVDPAKGEVYLVPYEGARSASKKRLISLRSLQRVLHKLKVKLSLLFLDTPVTQYLETDEHGVGLNGSAPANWRAAIPVTPENEQTHMIQLRRLEGQSNQEPSRLLTGLLGKADQDNNGTVTLGELLEHLEGTTEILPPRLQNTPHANIPLAQ